MLKIHGVHYIPIKLLRIRTQVIRTFSSWDHGTTEDGREEQADGMVMQKRYYVILTR